jgi:hypothetical protein
MSTAYVQFKGGMDLVSPGNAIDPGRCLIAINYEAADTGGYRSIAGYTRLGGSAPAGSGSILGLAIWKGDVYCIRQTTTTADLFKLAAGAWVSVGTGLPIGRYEMIAGNFFAMASSENLFMVCEAGRPWKFDGTTLSEITNAPTGAKFIGIHSNHLFLGFAVGSVQWSAIGDPDDWTAANGAGETGISDTLTGFANVTGALVIGGGDSIKVLYGSSAQDFAVKDYATNVGITPYTMASVGTTPVFKTSKGMSSLQAVQSYADFSMGDWATHVDPIFRGKAAPTCCLASRNRNQYRLYFADGTGVIATFAGQQLVGITTIAYPEAVTLCATGDASDGSDLNVFTNDTGDVFQMDTGTHFNGANINTYLTTAYNHMRAPTVRKRFRHLYLDVQSDSANILSVLPSYDFGNERIPRHRVLFKDTLASGGLWDFDTWDAFSWGTPLLDMAHMRLTGTATHIGLVINSSSAEAAPHTLHGYTVHFDQRRLQRG